MKIYIEGVRYADGGGLDARGRARREAVLDVSPGEDERGYVRHPR